MKRGDKVFVVGLFLVLLIIPFISAGFFSDWIGRITGEASQNQPVTLNITVSAGAAPLIYDIFPLTSVTLTDGPNPTYVTINFSVNETDGAGNLDNTTALLNLTRASEQFRGDSLCTPYEFAGNYANYTCNVTLWWYDVDGQWFVYANISDLNSNLDVFDKNITLNSLTGIVLSPSALTFATILAGNLNTTPSDFLRLNNTGNQDIGSGNVRINASDLIGETDAGQALYAGNFSASPFTGGNIECNASTTDATALVNFTTTAIVGSILTAGNYTLEDGTGQEDTYICLRETGAELSSQQFYTSGLFDWEINVV